MARRRMDFLTIDGNTERVTELIEDLKKIKDKFNENISTDYKIKEDVDTRLKNIIQALYDYRSELKKRGERMHIEALWVNW